MFFLSRIITIFILLIGFIIVIVMSFFSSPDYFKTPSITTQNELNTGDLIYASGSQIAYKKLSSFEMLLSSTETQIESNEGSISVDLSIPGKYLSSFRDLRKNYTFRADNFTIHQEGIGEIYIDSQTDPEKIFVMSLSTPIKISLKNSEKSEEYTNIFMHPHMYLVFDPSRGSFLKNADALRVETVYNLGYVGDSISQIQAQLGIQKYIDGDAGFLQVAIKSISEQDKLKQQQLKVFLNQDTSQLAGYAMVKRYMYVFVNTEKKKIFYKNIILKSLNEIMSVQSFDTDLIAQTRKDLEVLQSIDRQSYSELMNLGEEYMSILNGHSGQEFIIPKIMLSSLYDESIGLKNSEFLASSFSFFKNYDENKEFSLITEKVFLDSFRSQTLTQDDQILRYQYFSYLLEQQLLFLLSAESKKFSVDSFIALLTNHIDLVQLFYSSEKNTRISILYTYNDVLEKISLFLRSKYFQIERNENGLLVRSKDVSLAGTQVITLRSQLERIYDLYEENSKFLSAASSRDRAISAGILKTKEDISEYFSALKNYESYVSEYDISKKNLLNINTFGSQKDLALSESKIKSYLGQFHELSLDNAKINIQEKSYKVSGVYIRGKVFDFTIYPEAANRIQDIGINGVSSPFVYRLDFIQDEWKEKFKNASLQEKEQYDFQRFFIISFFTNMTNKVEDFDEIIIGPNEDKTEIVFKRDILLGTRGEFSTIQDILPLKYKNIKVKKDGELYDIFIESAALSLGGIIQSGGASYQAVMDSEYVLTNQDHYFENIQIRLYAGNETNIKSVFDDTQIYIGGRVDLTDFENRISQVFSNIESYISLYRTLNNTYGANNIVIQYSSRLKKMSFKFDLLEKDYTILMLGGDINTIYRGTSKLTNDTTTLENLGTYLQ